MRIRAMRAHLQPHMQDHENARRIKMCAHRRKRMFEYLKRKDPVRYHQCLMEVGVDKRAVEGELVIHRWWCVVFLSRSCRLSPPPARRSKLLLCLPRRMSAAAGASRARSLDMMNNQKLHKLI
jgi:hypothetical protein